MPKVFPKRTVFCCLSFDERSIMLLGYAIALGVIASVFLWQSSMQLWVPLAMGQNNDLTSASCHVQSTLLVCHDRFESDCQVKVDVKVGTLFGNTNHSVELTDYMYPTYGLPRPLAQLRKDYLDESFVNCWYWGDIAAPGNILYFVRPVVLGVGQWITGIMLTILGAGCGLATLVFWYKGLRSGWAAGSCRSSKQGYFYVEMDELSVHNYSSTPYDVDTKDPEARPINESAALIDRPERVAFMRKVVLTLFLQFGITFAIMATTVLVPSVRDWILLKAPFWIIYVALGVGLVTMIPLFLFAETFPLNLICVTVFSVAFGGMVGLVSTLYSVTVVFHACVLVMVILVSITAFTLLSRGVFPYFWAMLGCLLAITVACILLAVFLPFPSASQAICAIGGAILWSMFLLWDMAVIANYYSADMWAMGAVTIYLDTLNILLFLLRFLGGRSRQ